MARRAAAALAVVLLAAAGVTIWYRGTYHIWPGQAAGSRVHWCGRDYEQLLAVSMAGQPAACPTVVFLKTGQDSYLPYSLLGGP